jgi:copper resistance protein B
LSYDLVDRAVSPYFGVAYERMFGDTADFAEAEGEDTEAWFAVVGVKLRF